METQLYVYPATKVVNIYPTNGPITVINPPIRVVTRRTYKVLEDIRRCIAAGAIVGEILPDGSELILDFTNYNNDNRTAKGFQANPAGLTTDYFSVDSKSKDLNGDGGVDEKGKPAKEPSAPESEGDLPSFDDSDVNHDGVVDDKDMIPEVTGDETEEVFHPYDSNKDGYVDDAEYESATGKKRPHGKRK